MDTSTRSHRLVAITIRCGVAAALLVLTGESYAQDPSAVRLADQAEQLSRRGDVEATLQAYSDLVSRFPGDEYAPVALLRLAEGRWAAGDPVGAQAAIGQLREQYGRAPAAAGTWVLEGDMHMAIASTVEDLRMAHTAFGRVGALFDRVEYPDPIWRRRAGTGRGRVNLLLGELDLAAGELLAVIEDEVPGEETAEAQNALADVLIQQRDWTAAAETFQRVVDQSVADASTTVATRRLSLLHRTVFRPRVGGAPWTSVRRLAVPGRGLSDPVGIAVAPDGHVVVTDDGADLALTFDGAGALVATTVVERGGLPWSGLDGTLYVLDRRMIQRPLGEPTPATFAIPDGRGTRNLENLRAGARGVLDEWFVLDTNRGVMRFDRRGQYDDALIERGGDVEAVDIALDNRGRLHVLDRDQGRVLRFALDGAAEGTVASRPWRRPEALALDAVGNSYVLDRDEKTIDLFDPTGALVFTLGPQLPDGTELRSPRDVAVDEAGRLYVVDRDLASVFILE